MTTEQIVIAVLVLLVLVLGYYVWVYRSTCALVKGELGQELDELEVLLQDVKVEHFQGTTELQSRRDRVEARLQKIQALRTVGELKFDAKQEARLRRAVAEGNDYLASTYSGHNEGSVKLVRRIRDIMLMIIKKSKISKHIGCGRLMDWRNEKAGFKGIINSMTMASRYGYVATLDSVLPELHKLSDADIAKSYEPVVTVVSKPRERFEEVPNSAAELSDDEKRVLLQFYQQLNTAVCGLVAKDIIGRARGNTDIVVKELGLETKEEALYVIDGMEQLILHVQKKMCPDGKLDRKKIYEVYQRLTTMLCANDDFAMSLISQPLEVAIIKSLALFE